MHYKQQTQGEVAFEAEIQRFSDQVLLGNKLAAVHAMQVMTEAFWTTAQQT